MSRYRRRGRGKGTKCRKKTDDSLRKRVREIGGDKFGVLVVDSSKRNAEVWMTDFYGEPLWCGVRVAWVGRSSFSLEYRVEVDASDIGPARVVADGSTVQVFYDLSSARAMRMPSQLLDQLTEYEGRELPKRSAGG